MVYKIMKEHNGDVTVQWKRGRVTLHLHFLVPESEDPAIEEAQSTEVSYEA